MRASYRRYRSALCLFAAPALSLFVLSGCGDGPPRQEITTVQSPQSTDLQPVPDLSTAQRMRVQPPPGQERSEVEPHFHWETPEGWTEMPTTPLRTLNFQVGGDPDAECYLTILDGDGGGLLANLNRWYGQMAQDGITEEELAALEEYPLLGAPAKFVLIEGAFVGMGGGPAQEDFQIAGLANVQDGKAYFLKFTGPAALVTAELDAFKALAESIYAHSEAHDDEELSTLGAEEESLPSYAPAVPMPAEDAIVEEAVDSAEDTGAYGAEADTTEKAAEAAAMDGPIDPAKLQWTAPPNWTEGPERMMRLVTYQVGESECYVTVLPGQAGGAHANINRWYNQMGQPDQPAEVLDNLPVLSILGEDAPFVMITGDYTGMAAATLEGQMLLGALVTLPNHSIFIKMTGPEAEMAAQVDNFKAFCASFRP